MRIGIALPCHVRSFSAADVPDWARAVEDAGYATLAVSDRLAWPTPEPLTTLTAAAAVTGRVGLLSSVLLAPPRTNPGLFATAAATLDQLAGPGRLQLGLAPGARPSDYIGSGVDFAARGKAFDSWLEAVRAAWNGTTGNDFGPEPATAGGPDLLFGGASASTVRRATSCGVGWIGGGSTPAEFAAFARRVRSAFSNAGRAESPQLVVSVMASLGPERADTGTAAVADYYADLGEEFTTKAVANTLTTPEQLRTTAAEYQMAGADEMIVMLNDPSPTQVDTLRAALGPSQ